MRRRDLLRTLSLAGSAASLGVPARLASAASAPVPADGASQRAFWTGTLDRVSRPVLSALSQGKLRASMPVEAAPGHVEDRRRVTHLEALGRTLAGIAPWIEHGPRSGPEGALRLRYAELARASIAQGVDKQSPDYLNFGLDRQTIVDAAFLALALARAPKELCEALPATARRQLAEGLRATRAMLPPFNNWLLFAAMIEACLVQLGEPFDRMRISFALREHAAWYLGDGTYGDGPAFHADYYISFVIHPFLLQLMESIGKLEPEWQAMADAVRTRATRYAALQERMIAPDGSYPIVGRSIAYRCGAFHLLGDAALRGILPAHLPPAQVRAAMTAAIKKTLDAPGTFDANGWLRIGLAGHQPDLGETYISTGSLYLCTAAFLPLGLAPEHPFWSGPALPWTSQRLWAGENLSADHAL